MSSIFKESTIEKIKSIRKVFLWSAVCILIGELIVGAILILSQSFNLVIGKLMGTFALCAIVLFLAVSNFSKMEKEERVIQVFALISLVMNIAWLMLAILLIWEVVSPVEHVDGAVYYLSTRPSMMVKLMSVAINTGIGCFLISIVLSIKETVKPVRPLKIAALICELYCCIYAVVVTFGDITYTTDTRWYALAGLAGFAFIVMAIAAAIVSRSGRKKDEDAAQGIDKQAMQATIQEMVEKEVQERMKAEHEKAKRDAMPPLQAEDMPPIVRRDGEVQLNSGLMDANATVSTNSTMDVVSPIDTTDKTDAPKSVDSVGAIDTTDPFASSDSQKNVDNHDSFGSFGNTN